MLNNPSEQNEESSEKSFADILNEFETASHAPKQESRRPGGNSFQENLDTSRHLIKKRGRIEAVHTAREIAVLVD